MLVQAVSEQSLGSAQEQLQIYKHLLRRWTLYKLVLVLL